ncbi:hypothetical protein D9757_010341 [Collybiopsis confluens]|uniref:F-box domain-containing protein n=1 Tax=Collybiopsis confluens TaxID=2823264 RepID=A0A8H5GMF3_9AGAR|nr:hypothetical protein D9757_010341 [Collybiopsis confluens]
MDNSSRRRSKVSSVFKKEIRIGSKKKTENLDLDPGNHSETHQKILARCRSNDIPTSPAERSELRDLLRGIQRTLKTRKDPDSIIRLQLTHLVDCLTSLLDSPIRALPVEILNEVFGLLAVGHARSCQLTWVCSWWRTQVIALPTLWSTMFFTFPSFGLDSNDLSPVHSAFSPLYVSFLANFEDLSMPMKFRKECILRAGTHTPISLTMRLNHFPGYPRFHPDEPQVLAALIAQAPRWKMLDLSMNNKNYADNIRRVVPAGFDFTFPLLEVMHLRFRDDVASADDRGPFSQIFLHCPRLHTLDVSHLSTNDAIDLSHLVNLTISRFLSGSISRLLERCPLLQSLTLYEGFNVTSTPQNKVSHAQLSSLRLSVLQSLPLGWWDEIVLPNLKKIEIRGLLLHCADALSNLKTMLLRSKCVLEEVSLDGLWFSHRAVASFFEGIPVTSVVKSRRVSGKPFVSPGQL